MARKEWEAMVEKSLKRIKGPDAGFLYPHEAAKLLARQHDSFVRKVKKQRDGKGHSSAAICQPAYQEACNDIINSLRDTKKDKK